MSHPTDRFWEERAAARYLDALDAGDLETVAAMWEEAADDPRLESLLCDLDEGVAQELGLDEPFRDTAARVVDMARRSFPGAFPNDTPPTPLTASDIARRLESEPIFARSGPADRLAHARLLMESAGPPEPLGQPNVDRWFDHLGIVASPHYRRAFRDVASRMKLARGQQESRLAAARKANPPAGSGGNPS